MKGVVCLSVYNNEFGLPYCLNNIRKLAQCFDTFRIVVFYDESHDHSLQILNEFNLNNPIHLSIIVNNNTKVAERTANIAFARNSLLDYTRTRFADYDYFIMMDTNEY
jgi:glycosyltransferase involved in cell wall biosynthesis